MANVVNGEIYKHKFMNATAKIIEKTNKGYKVEFTDNSAKKPKAKTMYFNNIDFDKDKGFFEKIMKTGGAVKEDGVDLFEDYDQIPANLQLVLDKHEKSFEDGSYKGLEKALIAVKKLGYTFEYDLSGSAYDLRKIGQKGKSEVLDEDADNGTSNEQFAKGSTVKSEDELEGKKVATYKGNTIFDKGIKSKDKYRFYMRSKEIYPPYKVGAVVANGVSLEMVKHAYDYNEDAKYGQGGTTTGFNYSIGGL
jgi:hypothetical protein